MMRRQTLSGRGRRLGLVALALTAVTTLAGCGVSAESIALPGGADVGDNPTHLTIRFADVVDLVTQSAVKVNGWAAGRVTGTGLAPDGWTAEVYVDVRSDVDLPANAVASVQQTNLLGEKFIQLTAPTGVPPTGRLTDGAVIGIDRTRTATDIEQVLGALSLLLNGGGVDQIQPIVKELAAMTGGRESELRSAVNSAESLIGALNRQRDSITEALDGVNALTSRARDQQQQIQAVLDELPAGVAVLNEQRPQFVEMLKRVDALGQVGSDILLRSREDLITDLRALRPVLQNLAKVTPEFIDDAAIVPTYPFPDASVSSIFGGTANVLLSIDTQIATTLGNIGVGQGDPKELHPTTTIGPYVTDPRNPWANGNGPDKRTTVVLPLLPVPLVMQRAVVPAPAPGVSPMAYYLQPPGGAR